MSYVITCGDEGVQINEGTRLAFAGAGFRLEGFSEVVPLLKKLFGDDLAIASSGENDWTRQQLELSTWEQTDASMQQHVQALADKEGLQYAGFLPFADPEPLDHGIKGHMVRPKGIHIANKICLTIGGGEQTYHLGHYLISADWLHLASKELAKKVLEQQIDFYHTLGSSRLEIEVSDEGELDDTTKAANSAVLKELKLI